jgi:predicted nuclease with TOPRIM domain
MTENNLTKIQKEYTTLQEKINALNLEMQEKSKVLMHESFKEFFAKYDDVVENLWWTAYTPYFMDGEACEFSVNDVYIKLKDDEDPCEYEGSDLYDKSDLDYIKNQIASWEEYNKNPTEAAAKYRSEYIRNYDRDPFSQSRWSNKTPEQQMSEWKPSYKSLENYQSELALAEKLISEYPDLKNDFENLKSMVSGIDEDIMYAMFGDHVKVIVSKSGIETEEYQHD